MAVGNTFGATALSSYGGFWIAVGIILTPGGFNIAQSLSEEEFLNSFGLFLMVSMSGNSEELLANLTPGLVYFHLRAPAVHPEVHRGVLLAFLLAGSGLPAARNQLPPA